MKLFRIAALTALVLSAFAFGFEYGRNVGAYEMAQMVGPSLLKCVNLLGGQIRKGAI